MRSGPSKPWTERPLNHHFGAFSMHSDGDYANKFEWDDKIKPNEEDLVINFKDYPDHTLNFNAVLYNKENPAFDMSGGHISPHYAEGNIESDDLIIKFSMFTVFNKSDKSV
jgi:hypothetical protein